MMIKENILFAFAHLDDETILSFGTIEKLSKHNNIFILVFCGKGRYIDLEHSKEQQQQRIEAFKQLYKRYDFYLCENNDLSLNFHNTKNEINRCIAEYKPTIVFTHSTADLMFEHRIVAEQTLVVCRKIHSCAVKAIYAASSPAQQATYCQFGSFQPNYFVDISEFIEQKKAALERYSMELPSDNNDIRSAESIIAQNRQYGRLMGVGYCEAYQQLFKLD